MAYYPTYTGTSVSIENALNSMGIKGDYANRKRIAQANGISDYSGTSAQNTQLLDLLKHGLLINPDSTAQTEQTPQNTALVPTQPTENEQLTENTNFLKKLFMNLTDKQKKALKIGAIAVGVGLIGYGAYKATKKSSAKALPAGNNGDVKGLGCVSRREKSKKALNGTSKQKGGKRKSTKKGKVKLV